MRTRADYDRAFAAVRDVIHRWDPYGLIRGGAPADEWDSEIASVVAQIPHIKSESDAALAISRVFSRAFQPQGFAPPDCSDVGRQLLSAIHDLQSPAGGPQTVRDSGKNAAFNSRVRPFLFAPSIPAYDR